MAFLLFLLPDLCLPGHKGFIPLLGSAGDTLDSVDRIITAGGIPESDASFGESVSDTFSYRHFRVLCIHEPVYHGCGQPAAFGTSELRNPFILHG